ncbi:MAG TPA: ABC transporter ATP-binding protein [Anaerohalosphaeraceae bacterium]|nr:ABC transporter ATP-binding protein [Anaerohalosphaeraceae bacterium]HOL89090.1 ABC transporter ATP-binding protein [Anaerohalosphaeraceae bacterium]HPP56630.1 ABC transporter ATP-binding protein [Anaerohalosphaeraceae bacterium]
MSDTKGLSAFWRVWEDVWPQWPRLVKLVFWSVMIALMISVSFATVIPLLKVMMSEEGLHGWVDRKICNWRYGLDFYVPDRSDFLGEEGNSVLYYLLITRVHSKSWAKKNGLHPQDRIVGVSPYLSSDGQRIFSGKMLEALATCPAGQPLTLQVISIADAVPAVKTMEAVAPEKPALADWAQWPVSFLPREETKETKLQAIVLIIIGMIFITILRCMARFYQHFLAEKIVLIANTRLRERVFAHAMYMPVGFFSSRGTSDTTSRIFNDVSQSCRGIKVLLGKTLREPLTAAGCIGAAFWLNWKLTAIFLTAAPLVLGLFVILGRKIKKATKKSLAISAQLLGRIQEAMRGVRVVKVYNRQDHEIGLYEKTNQALLKQLIRIARVEALTNPLMDVLGMFAGSAALLLGAAWVIQGYEGMQSSTFFALVIFLGTAAESVRKVSDVWNEVQRANAAAERVFAVLDEPLEKEEPDAFDLAPLREKMVFEEVRFTYPGASLPALNGITLEVPAGQTVAIVGPNGSGKSTLVNLIARFYDPDSGRILIDGRDIRRATLRSLRGQIGLVTQDIVTFRDTIANNIAYGKPGASREEVIEAARRAYAHEFIEPLPEGYDTIIGEHSSGFSGGQMQRIVIARAILKNPAILIFDEAMSQIDADSEAKIHAALQTLLKGRTCFLIAHRFSTVISADRIVVLDKGRIVGQGRHEDLIRTCQVYKNLYETQLIVPQES